MSLVLPGVGRSRHIWGEVWREGSAALVGAAFLAAEIAGKAKGYGPPHAWVWIDVALGACSLVLLLWRRRFPFAVCLVLTALSAVSATSIATSAIALISLTTHRKWRPVVICSVAGLVSGWVFQFFFPTPHDGLAEWISTIVIGLLAIALSVAIGIAIGARRLLVANLRTQLEVAQESQQLRIEQAKAAERARIAREMHDVLAHRISLVAIHSGALAYRTDLSEEELRESTAIIRDNAHAALTELREVLGVLRDPTAGPRHPDAPQPTLADLPALVSDTEATDGPVELTMPDDLSGMSELVSRNAFRIAQEGLTNRRKHAAGQPISIRFSKSEGELALTIRNPMPAFQHSRATAEVMPDSGLGLVGARERAVLVGGELTSGRDRGGDFVVHARLPWPRDDS